MQASEPFAVLVVEDEFLVALDLATMLEDAAFTVLGPTAETEVALKLISQNPPDAALLDVNLGGEKTSYDIARRLSALNIPYAFLTGYEKHQLPVEFQNSNVFSKPVVFQTVVNWLRTVYARQSPPHQSPGED